jgi:polysaccharide deacetylase family protein (PEP-CTERM system associated)
MKPANAMSVDVEDYFQTEAMSAVAPRARWERFAPRVEANTCALFELFAQYQAHATFFFMGWVAERFPQVVRQAHELGHEVGCHSYWHHPVFGMSSDEFRKDTYRARNVIQDITGAPVKGYRAPNFSINQSVPWAYLVLEELGFEYDSSVYPIHHELYGNHRAQRHPYLAGAKLIEIPIATWRVLKQNVPVAGGAYLRILPYALIRHGIRSMNRNENAPAVLYMHPWEIDDSQPRLEASWKSRTRQYTGLAGMRAKVERLLQDFTLASIYDAIYLPLRKRRDMGEAVADQTGRMLPIESL